MHFGFEELILFSMLFGSTGNAGNHLLDYASTDAYWNAKNVPVSFEGISAQMKLMRAEDAADLIRQLGSDDPQTREAASRKLIQKGMRVLPQLHAAAKDPDPEIAAAAQGLIKEINLTSKAAAVRQLMIIRTLGELKDRRAMVLLTPLLDSGEMFVAEYARRAVAQIEGKLFDPIVLTQKQRETDLWLLPADVGIVAQFATTSGKRLTIDDLLSAIPHNPAEDYERKAVCREITEQVLKIAERVGDVRVDGATACVSANINNDAGYALVIVRGQYDSAAVRQLAMKAGFVPSHDRGIEIIAAGRGGEAMMILQSEQCLVYMIGAKPEALPIDAMVKALNTGKGKLNEAKDIVKLMERIDTTQAGWAVGKIPDAFRQLGLPIIPAFDSVTAVVKQDATHAGLEIVATGSDERQVKDAVAALDSEFQKVIRKARRVATDPVARPIADVLDSIKLTADGKEAKLSAKITRDLPALVRASLAMSAAELGRDDDDAPIPAPPPQQLRPATMPAR